MAEKKINLELTPAEALVLFEWIARSDSENRLAISHPAEQRVLWLIEGQLERILKEPLVANYRSVLDDARRKVIGDK